MVRLLLALWLGMFGISVAFAAPVKYDFTGTVTRNDFPTTFPPTTSFFPYEIGERIALTFTLQTSYADADLSSRRGEYYNPTGIYDIGPVLAVDIGGTGGFAIHQYLQVFDNYTDVNGETYDGLTFEVGEPQRGWQSRFLFRTSDLSVLDSDAIPTSIDPGDFEIATFQRLGRPGERIGGGTIDAEILEIAEPATLAVLGMALFLLAALRRYEAVSGVKSARSLS
jgi:hypothetical protein